MQEDCEWEEDFIEQHTSNPSLNANDYYFQQGHDPTGGGLDFFTIVPKQWFDRTGTQLDEEEVVPPALLPNGFYELQEGDYEYDGDQTSGRYLLISAGFIEKKMF